MKQSRVRRIGLTGGIAAGKSSCSDFLIREGYRVLDGDKTAHRLMEPGQTVYRAIVDAFGRDMLDEEGRLDRKKLGSLVFQDAEALATLNSLTHSLIYQDLAHQANHADPEELKDGLLFFDLPLLFESWELAKGLDFDSIWLVVTSQEEQIRRMKVRDGLTSDQALDRIHAQMGDEEKILKADQIIYNEGTLDALYQQIRETIALERDHEIS